MEINIVLGEEVLQETYALIPLILINKNEAATTCFAEALGELKKLGKGKLNV